ncbi:MalY/PatB family protein [Enterococcus alishanensis]|uniref:Pyridoxal phosphate-dependent aminotransferase n=1 Tax=Enterococcus alishanensis TaxID=1303817 RepID=A0ABS6TDL6_9ENTE|nr:MalY/PatB family protein [Enterococcus alishanensis]MBV7390967.1 pyridoxal phosphate-dependent aminotransferase [Enterococcus alishanensis]
MPVDFDQLIDRRQNNSYKWDIAENELPMWVADMDFETAPAVTKALENRISQGAFGYNTVPPEFFESIQNWWWKKHQFKLATDAMMFCTGVVPAISLIVRKMTKVDDQIVLITPVYNIFFNSILNNQRQVLASEMTYQDSRYGIDYLDLEKKLADPKTTMLIFCNPHNPIGKVWDKSTLAKIGELCLLNDVLILSDEIHCDLTHPEFSYTPMAAISKEIAQQTITCWAPTKAFNLAGLQTSVIYVQNPKLFQLVHRGINIDEVAEPNTFAIQAAMAAFDEGGDWLEELKRYLTGNRRSLNQFIHDKLPEIKIISSEATYLAWLDCSRITNDSKMLADFLRKETGLILSAGDIFGGNGRQFLRWNYACPQIRLADGLDRFYQGIEKFKQNSLS